MLRRTSKLLIVTTTLALVAAMAFSATVSAAQGGNQGTNQGGNKKDTCLQEWTTSVGSYRVDWTSYYDTSSATWYFGYVESASNTASAFLDGVTVFATAADLAGAGSTSPLPPVATVSPGGWNGVVLGAIGTYGHRSEVSAIFPYGLDTYLGKHPLGSYTLCFSSLVNPR